VIFLGHSSKKYLPSFVYDKVMLSVTITFTDSRHLGTRRHSTKTYLPSVKHSQRVISSRLKLTAVIFAESRDLTLSKVATLTSASSPTLYKPYFAECPRMTLGKVYFVFSFSNQTFCGMFLHYIDLHVPFWHNYKSVCYNY
jgi:hypothetical protein